MKKCYIIGLEIAIIFKLKNKIENFEEFVLVQMKIKSIIVIVRMIEINAVFNNDIMERRGA